MPRNMSFMLTTQQVKDETKDVTRRMGWLSLKSGDILWAVKKAMGLRKGEKIQRLKKIRVINAWREPLNVIDQRECVREGFPHMTPAEFVEMFCATHKGCRPETEITRIEFEYLQQADDPVE